MLVVFGHSYAEVNQYPGDPVLSAFYWLHKSIYSFHMPLFMFISGLLFANSEIGRPGRGYASFVLSRAKRLLLPYFAISAAAFPVKAALSAHAMRPVELTFASFVHTFIYPLDNTIFFFWFLPTLFAVSLFMPPLFSLAKGRNGAFYAALITAALMLLNIMNPIQTTLFNLKGIAKFAVFFWMGCLYCLGRAETDAVLGRPWVTAALLAALAALNAIRFPAPNPYAGFAAAVTGICLSVGAVSLFLEPLYAALKPMHGWSYQIYLLSWFPQVFCRVALYEVMHLGFFAAFAAALALGLALPVLAAKFIGKRAPFIGPALGLR